MAPSAPQLPPRKTSTSQMDTDVPPARGRFRSSPPAANPIHSPSGEKNGPEAPSVSGMGVVCSDARGADVEPLLPSHRRVHQPTPIRGEHHRRHTSLQERRSRTQGDHAADDSHRHGGRRRADRPDDQGGGEADRHSCRKEPAGPVAAGRLRSSRPGISESSSAASAISCTRRRGSFRRQRSRRRRRSRGVEGGSRRQSTSSRRIDARTSETLRPSKGRRPVSISYSTQPKAQTSVRLSTSSPRTCSGLM